MSKFEAVIPVKGMLDLRAEQRKDIFGKDILGLHLYESSINMTHSGFIAWDDVMKGIRLNQGYELIESMVLRMLINRRGMTYTTASKMAKPITEDIVKALTEWVDSQDELNILANILKGGEE